MRFQAVLGFICGVLSAAVYAAPPVPEQIISGTPHEALFAVDFDGDNGYAVGAGGEILKTTDAGATWVRDPSPTKLSLLGVAISGQRVIAVGQMGVVLTKSGDGEWQLVESGTQERLFSVDVNAQGNALTVGAFGALLRSSDGGKSWAAAAPQWQGVFDDSAGRLGDFFEPSLYAVQIDDENRAWIAGELGLVANSSDGGASWQIGHAGTSRMDGVDPTLFGLTVRADGIGFAVGQEGYVLKTEDGGASWSVIPRPTHANLLSVSSGTDGVLVATGMRDMVFSRDDGKSWERISGADIATGWYSGAARPRGVGQPLIVGNAGRILRLAM